MQAPKMIIFVSDANHPWHISCMLRRAGLIWLCQSERIVETGMHGLVRLVHQRRLRILRTRGGMVGWYVATRIFSAPRYLKMEGGRCLREHKCCSFSSMTTMTVILSLPSARTPDLVRRRNDDVRGNCGHSWLSRSQVHVCMRWPVAVGSRSLWRRTTRVAKRTEALGVQPFPTLTCRCSIVQPALGCEQSQRPLGTQSLCDA